MTGLPADVLLPERARLFHIGPPKTATTALQFAAAALRADLLQHGVRYPGTQRTHRREIAAFVGRPVSWVAASAKDAPPPPREYWDRLLAEIDADTSNRILLGHEYAAGADDALAAGFVQALGPRTHVAITLRPYGAMLPSIWQEHNKAGNVEPFATWLRRVLDPKRPGRVVERFHVRHDQGWLARRWAKAVGPDNVTVVVLDPSRPDFVFNSFEAMLGLPAGILATADTTHRSNRSLTVPEIELFRRLNGVIRDHAVAWKDYERIVVEGAALRLLGGRRPPEGEARLRLPDWAADRADEEARRHVEEIRDSGVRVIGDLDRLAEPALRRDPTDEDHTAVTHVPIEVALAALEGAVSGALCRGADFGEPPPPPRLPPAPRDLTTRQLLGLLRRRLKRALRGELSRPPEA